jgi:insulysin
MLKKVGYQDAVFDEYIKMKEIGFKYMEKREPINMVCDLSNRMNYYKNEHILSGSDLVFNKDVDQIKEMINIFSLENLIIIYSSQKTKDLDKFEKYYNTHYSEGKHKN